MINFFMPAKALVRDNDFYHIKYGRLFVTFLHITIVPLMIFTVVNFLTGKTLAAKLDLIALASFIFWTFHFKTTGKYKISVYGFVITCQFVISSQHLIAPLGLGSNLLWAPLIIISSNYLLGKKNGLRLGVICIILMIIAETLPYFFPIIKEGFKNAEILQYNIGIIIATGISAFAITNRITTEESQYQQQMDQQYKNIFEQKETNSALLNIVSHDIANPLTAIQNRIELMIKKTGANDQTGKILEQIKKMHLAIDSVRNYRAIESGKLQIILKPVDLTKTILESLESLEIKIKDKGIRIRKNFNIDESIWIKGDEVSLHLSVLNNLLTNAIKFSHPNGVIELDIKRRGERVLFSIRDHGFGIPEEIIPYLFSPTKPTTRIGSKGEKGTGLGMPIMKMFLDRFEAHINVYNAIGGGTQFDIEFLANEAQKVNDHEAA